MGLKTILHVKKRPLIMGVLNLTPDSFSDGGRFNTLNKALAQVRKFEDEGADLIDIGGESTGPNSKFVSCDEEIRRVIPVLREVRKITNLPISIDTYKSKVAKLALDEGVDIVNDVTALRGDEKMAKVVVEYGCPLVMMYSKDNTPRTTVRKKVYKNVLKTIIEFFGKRISYAEKNGLKIENIILDPGMGQFISAIPRYSFEIIARLNELKVLKMPILIGISRKSFLMGDMDARLERGIIAAAIACLNGADIIRTHDVAQTVKFFENFNN